MGEAVANWSTHKIGIGINFKYTGQQLRAYGPHVTEAFVELAIPEGQMTGRIGYLDENYARRVVTALVSEFCERGTGHDTGPNHYFSPHLVLLERTEFEENRRAMWHVVIETPFTD